MSHQSPKIIRVICGECCESTICTSSEINLLPVDRDDLISNITIGYDKFMNNSDELPNRILDLLQIAAYVFCSDRLAHRGDRKSINNDAWARSFEYHIPVLDLNFWKNEKTLIALKDALLFMTGDRNIEFVFKQTDKNPAYSGDKQLSLFSGLYNGFDNPGMTDVMLFSGGLDSLAGAIQRLNDFTDRSLCVVSHKSNRSTTHTQNALITALNQKYNGRVKPYGFECCNHNGLKSKDETQRSRMFLFSAIAFALCHFYGKHEFYVYENGITSMNLSKQADVINARASRTTHPKTLGLLRKFYKLFDPDFDIIAPYYNKTKAEVLDIFKTFNETNIISSSVSCSSSRTKPEQVPHCGCCSQCIDRRFSMFAAGLDGYDATYANDFISAFPNNDHNETRQRLYITMRFANLEDISTKDAFLQKYPSDLTDLIEYWQGARNVEDKLDEIYSLVCRYGESVISAATEMRNKYDSLTLPVNEDSLLGIISSRMYMQTPHFNRVVEIDAILRKAILDIFQREKPRSENDLNDKIHSILSVNDDFSREYPVLLFGLTSYKADHAQGNLIIESKYIRQNTTPSKASDGIAADITKIPENYGVMFIVYDPEGRITDRDYFINSFERKRKDCFVRIYP